VYGQWFHVYESDNEIVSLIFRTYASVFPHVAVWFTGASDLLLLGFDRPERALDLGALEARFRQPDFAAGFARVEIDSFPQLLAHELIPLGTLHAEALEGPVQTLRRPILSDWAARAFFQGERAWVSPYLSGRHREVSIRNSLLRRYAGGGTSLPEEILETAARETCRMNRGADCATFFARWAFDHPDSAHRGATLSELRRDLRPENPHIAPRLLGGLLTFYTGRVDPESDELTSARAQRLTLRFLNYYHHAVPFDPRALEEAWDRCQGDGCDAARAQSEKSLWGLDLSRARRAGSD
jgi:hypothetical protein